MSTSDDVTVDEAVAYLDRTDPHGTRSLAVIAWAIEQVRREHRMEG